MDAREHTQANLELLREKLDSGGMRSARIMANSLHPSELARLLESLPLKDRAVLWEMVDHDLEGDVLVGFGDVEIDGIHDLVYALGRHKPGDVVLIRYLRGDEEREVRVTLTARNPE